MEDVDKEISEMKISLNSRARIVAETVFNLFNQVSFTGNSHFISLVPVVLMMIINVV